MKLWQTVQQCRRALSLESRADGGLRIYGALVAALLATLVAVLTLSDPATARGESPPSSESSR